MQCAGSVAVWLLIYDFAALNLPRNGKQQVLTPPGKFCFSFLHLRDAYHPLPCALLPSLLLAPCCLT